MENQDFQKIYDDAVKEATYYAYKNEGQNLMIFPCGFAWVNVKPGTSKFAKWLKEKELASKDSFKGGVTIWVGDFNQSYWFLLG